MKPREQQPRKHQCCEDDDRVGGTIGVGKWTHRSAGSSSRDRPAPGTGFCNAHLVSLAAWRSGNSWNLRMSRFQLRIRSGLTLNRVAVANDVASPCCPAQTHE